MCNFTKKPRISRTLLLLLRYRSEFLKDPILLYIQCLPATECIFWDRPTTKLDFLHREIRSKRILKTASTLHIARARPRPVVALTFVIEENRVKESLFTSASCFFAVHFLN